MRLSQTNPMNRAWVANLACEAVVFALAIAGMIQVDAVTVGVAVGCCGAAMVMAIAAAARWRTGWGWYLGWITQVIAVGMGFLSPWMFGVGGLFVGLHLVIFILGRRLDPAKRTATPGR